MRIIALLLLLTCAGLAQVPPSITFSVPPAPIVLRVTCDGTPPFTYQWYKGTVAIAGATESSLTITDPKAAGVYSVVITNAAGSIKSGTFRLSNTTSLSAADATLTRKQK